MKLTDKELDQIISKNLKRIILSKKIKKSIISKNIGISEQVIYHYESNRTRIPASALYKFADFLNVRLEEFYICEEINIYICPNGKIL